MERERVDEVRRWSQSSRPEVRDSKPTVLGDQHVSRLEVAMDHLVSMDHSKAAEYVSRDRPEVVPAVDLSIV